MFWLKLVAASAIWQNAFEAQPDPGKRDLANRDYFVVEAEDPEPLVAAHGWTVEEPFPIADHWLFSTHRSAGNKAKRSEDAKLHGATRFYASEDSKLQKRAPIPEDAVPEAEISEAEARQAAIEAEFHIHDPLFKDQWHIYNNVELGHDMNVLPLWRRNITGQGITVAIVDDGLDYDHPDFEESFSLEGSWDYNLHQQHPKPLLADDNHGTRCAGEIAAGKNNVCGVGVAPGAKVAGLRILSGTLTTADEARSLIHRYNVNDIYSCSWGPPDNGKVIEGPPAIVKRAEVDGVENGRDGKGSIYVVASGNGDMYGDNCNYDGYTNSIYSITIGAIDRQNRHPYYAESCSANMVVTYSSNYFDKITTSDRLDPLHPEIPKCTSQHTGTSAAAPIAAGIFALVLQQRPELTWRDLQYLARDTAKYFKIEPAAGSTPPNRVSHDWQITADGHRYHDSYGYGLLDAEAIVNRSATWELVKPQTWYFLPSVDLHKPITPTSEFALEVSQNQWEAANMDHLEHVRVRVSWEYEIRGALRFELESPAGIVSELAGPRSMDRSSERVDNWHFLSVVHWNETGAGMWKLRVTGPEEHHGVVYNWQLKLFGQAKDPSLVKKYSEVWNEYEPEAPVVQDAVDLATATTSTPPEPAATEPAGTEPTATEPTATEPTATDTEPGQDHKPPPQRGSHSVWYFVIASILGALILTAIIVPTVYLGFWIRKKSSRYVPLGEEEFELQDTNQNFEIDDDDEFLDETFPEEAPEDPSEDPSAGSR